jgi:hypothetical protein
MLHDENIAQGSGVFSREWLDHLKNTWNQKDGLAEQLRAAHFNSVVAFGLPDEDSPRAFLVIREGAVLEVATRSDDDPDWDLRADRKQWERWLNDPPGLLALGMAFTTRSLQFRRGNYLAMIKDPLMAESFKKSFMLMAEAYQRTGGHEGRARPDR